MLTNRDLEVIRAIAKYRALTTDQIIDLHFPSYATCQRRLRKGLIPNRYLLVKIFIFF